MEALHLGLGDGTLEPGAHEGAVLADTAGMPLAARLRPRDLAEFVGQQQAVGPGRPLRRMLDRGALSSLVLWGPPGVGKTSLARVIAGCVDATWVELSAVTAGVKDVRRALEEGRGRLEMRGRRTLLFIDEIHRFNKAQQDALLPGVEAGWVTLVGATTENPFFELNAPLLSRCQLVRLEPLEPADVRVLLERAVADVERGLAGRVALTDDAFEHLAAVAEGDARAALSALEVAASAAGVHGPAGTLFDDAGADGPAAATAVELDLEAVAGALRRFRYDRASDAHYDQVSAFIKSLRGSDPDAAVYWLTRMLAAGEDPRFLARRMVILASEDVGLADRGVLPLAVAAFEALDRVGMPEARYALTHAAIALAVAPKSNAVTRAMAAADALIAETGDRPVPVHLRDTHHRSMARWLSRDADGRRTRAYEYPHDHPGGVAPDQPHLPEGLEDRDLFEPTDRGHEAPLGPLLDRLRSGRRPTDD
jgi:putative ATPase